MIALADAVYIYGSYAITAAVLGVLSLSIIRRGHRLADQVDDDRKNWT